MSQQPNHRRGFIRGWGRVYVSCLLRLKPLANPPLQVIENAVLSQYNELKNLRK